MELQHFGLRHPPLGKESTELWDDGMLARLHERFQWLLQSPGGRSADRRGGGGQDGGAAGLDGERSIRIAIR
jgi:hypothetical protein